MRRFTLLLTLLVLSACATEREPVAPLDDEGDDSMAPAPLVVAPPSQSSGPDVMPQPDLDRLVVQLEESAGAARAPSRLFPRVIVHPRGTRAGSKGAPVVDNFADALSRIQPGGVVMVADGTYQFSGPGAIDRPVTIQALNGSPVLLAPSGSVNFAVSQVPQGQVVFRDLTFDNADGSVSLAAFFEYDEILIEGVSVEVTTGSAGFFFGGSTAGAGNVTVRESEFSGGAYGILASAGSGTVDVKVHGSSFTGHHTLAVQHQGGATGVVEDSDFTDCGVWRCIGGNSGARSDILNNRITTAGVGIHVREGEFLVEGNEIDAARQGIEVAGNLEVLVTGNVVDPCGHDGCLVVWGGSGDDITIHDNIFRSVLSRRPLFVTHAVWPDGAGSLTITENRFEGVGTPSDLNDPGTYPADIPFQVGAWWPPGVEGVPMGPPVEFSGNRIENAAVGVRAFHGGVVEGRDNTFRTISGEVLGAHDRGINRLQFNDVEGYQFPLGLSGSPVKPVAHEGTLDVTCNWWGSPAGPVNTGGIDPGTYTPWATSPVAGTGATSCSGGL